MSDQQCEQAVLHIGLLPGLQATAVARAGACSSNMPSLRRCVATPEPPAALKPRTLDPDSLLLQVLVEGPAAKLPGHLSGRTCSGRKVVLRATPLHPTLDALPGLHQLAHAAAAATATAADGHLHAAAGAAQRVAGGSGRAGQQAPEAEGDERITSAPSSSTSGGVATAEGAERWTAAAAQQLLGKLGDGESHRSAHAERPSPDAGVASSIDCTTGEAGQVAVPRPGEYVAVWVRGYSSSTLQCEPLARTSIQEFARTFGSTVPQGTVPG